MWCTARMRRKRPRTRSPSSSDRPNFIRALEYVSDAPAMILDTSERVNLLGLERAALESLVFELGSQPFRARQLMHWLYKRGEGRISEMTDLPKDFRKLFEERPEVGTPEIVSAH